MATSCVFRYMARFMCLGIALDNGVNALYYLQLENWSILSTIFVTAACVILNGILYSQGATEALEHTWQDFKQFSIKSYIPYLISITSAFMMASFTLHNYFMSAAIVPNFVAFIFAGCYFIGTHSLIIQATKNNIYKKYQAMPSQQKTTFGLWFTMFMLATATAMPQWSNGVSSFFNSSSLTAISTIITFIGETYFVAQLSIWLASKNKMPFNNHVYGYIVIAASLNALGFACMTEYDSFITNSLNNHTTFSLGFLLSFFMMFKSLCIWQANVRESKQIFQLAHHQA